MLVVHHHSLNLQTATSTDNGFNPVWLDGTKGSRTQKNDVIEFQVGIADLACLRFVVYDEDVFGDSNAIAQVTML